MQRQPGAGTLPDIRPIGFFRVQGFDAKPIVSPEEMKTFLKPIAWSKINQIHNGKRFKVGKNCKDFHKENQDNNQVDILSNTKWIERAVDHFKPNSEDKRKIFARTAVLCDLVTTILQPNAKPKNFKFEYNKDKKELKIWAIESRDMKDMGFGPFVEQTLTSEEEMAENKPIAHGYQGTYQLTKLIYPEFVVYTSKEIDAVEKVWEGEDVEEVTVYEIKSPSNLTNFDKRISYILTKNVAFAKINKLIIGELEHQGETAIIKQIRVVENIESLDASKLVKACREELGKVLKSILDLVKNYPNGTLSTSYQGIHFNKPNGEKSLIAKPKLKNGTPKSHEMYYSGFRESDVQYLLDPKYEFKSYWPIRDSQDFKNFLKHGFTNRKKKKYVLLFSKNPIDPEIRKELEKAGYSYNQTKFDYLKGKAFSDVFDCFVLKETHFVNTLTTAHVFCFFALGTGALLCLCQAWPYMSHAVPGDLLFIFSCIFCLFFLLYCKMLRRNYK